MKLIVVNRAKLLTFHRLSNQFAGVPGVKVLLDRRIKQTRERQEEGPFKERRQLDRRRLVKTLLGRDYIVVHLANKANGESYST